MFRLELGLIVLENMIKKSNGKRTNCLLYQIKKDSKVKKGSSFCKCFKNFPLFGYFQKILLNSDILFLVLKNQIIPGSFLIHTIFVRTTIRPYESTTRHAQLRLRHIHITYSIYFACIYIGLLKIIKLMFRLSSSLCHAGLGKISE